MHTDATTVTGGIDISKDYIAFFIFNGKDNPSGRRPRGPKALAKLVAELASYMPKRVVMEATGGLELAV